MTDISNFQQLATYYLKVYDDNTVEYFNRRDLPIGLATKEQQLKTEAVKIKLSKHRAEKLRGMAEVINSEHRVYVYTRDLDRPDLPPQSRAKTNRYLERVNEINQIVLGL